jgi:CheY-like chemotaxis protein
MVDDNETDLDIGQRFYRYSKLENPFLTFASGQELLAYLAEVEAGQKPFPAVVLLDVNMPQLSGFETLRRIREKQVFGEIPVIVMLTNSDNPQDIESAMQMGANGYQPKHFEVDGFVTFLQGLFK